MDARTAALHAGGGGREVDLPGVAARVFVLRDGEAVAREAAALAVDAVRAALDERDRAHVVLTGGSSAVALYRELASRWRDAVDWTHVHLWWGDERLVPPDHPESNASVALGVLLRIAATSTASGQGDVTTDVRAGITNALPVPAENVHPFPVQAAIAEAAAPDEAARRYVEEISAVVPAGADGIPRFDVVFVGVGADGHVLSVFPGSPMLDDDAPLAGAVPAPEHIGPHIPRLTLHPRILPAAGVVIAMVPGSSKAGVVAGLLGGERDPSTRPALLALGENAVWLLDEGSAAELAPAR